MEIQRSAMACFICHPHHECYHPSAFAIPRAHQSNHVNCICPMIHDSVRVVLQPHTAALNTAEYLKFVQRGMQKLHAASQHQRCGPHIIVWGHAVLYCLCLVSPAWAPQVQAAACTAVHLYRNQTLSLPWHACSSVLVRCLSCLCALLCCCFLLLTRQLVSAPVAAQQTHHVTVIERLGGPYAQEHLSCTTICMLLYNDRHSSLFQVSLRFPHRNKHIQRRWPPLT
jgi:hypothetical protein